MATAPQFRRRTVDDLIAIEAETGQRFEIVNGEFVELGVSIASADTGAAFVEYLRHFARTSGIGRVYGSDMMYALPKSTRRPDASLILKDHLPTVDSAAFVGPPDVVVEVVSPSDIYSLVRGKVQEWLDAGARVVWLAEPNSHEVTIYRRGATPLVLTDRDTLGGGDVLPGFSVAVAELFPSLEPAPIETDSDSA